MAADILSRCTYHVVTYGCQMNKHDSERVSGLLEEFGSVSVDTIEEADVVVFMTCCVREAADVRLRGQVETMKNYPLREGSPLKQRVIAIGGCIGQRDGQGLIDDMPHVTTVFGTHNLDALPHLISSALTEHTSQAQILDSTDSFWSDLPSVREHAWSAWLPITMGCNNFCTYCIVPYVRGREKSRPIEEIEAEAKTLVADGVKEITLLGQNVNSYGRDLYGQPRFADVLEKVAGTGVRYLRYATSHPKDLTDEVISKFATLDCVAPALHLPAQSGSNRILKAMNRRYTREHYLELVRKVREACPDIALSTDIIVGFPGETEEDFQDTYDLVKEVGYSQVFTFIYSKREGTPAARMEDDTPHEVIQERFERLVNLVQEKAYERNQLDADAVVEVLVESLNKRDASSITGRTPKNQTVHATVPEGVKPTDLIGKVCKVQVTLAKTWYLSGHVVEISA